MTTSADNLQAQQLNLLEQASNPGGPASIWRGLDRKIRFGKRQISGSAGSLDLEGPESAGLGLIHFELPDVPLSGYLKPSSTVNDRPRYTDANLDGDAVELWFIEWDGSQWVADLGTDRTFASGDDVPTPDLVQTWVATGLTPLPLVVGLYAEQPEDQRFPVVRAAPARHTAEPARTFASLLGLGVATQVVDSAGAVSDLNTAGELAPDVGLVIMRQDLVTVTVGVPDTAYLRLLGVVCELGTVVVGAITVAAGERAIIAIPGSDDPSVPSEPPVVLIRDTIGTA